MEIIALFLLYCIAQKPEFHKSIQPLMSELKNSEEVLRFIKDLSSFADLFTQNKKTDCPTSPNSPPPSSASQSAQNEKCDHEKPQSQTKGIADDFIEKFLSSYLRKKS